MHGAKNGETCIKGKKAIGGRGHAAASGFQAWISIPAPLPVQSGFQNPHQHQQIQTRGTDSPVSTDISEKGIKKDSDKQPCN